MVNTIFTIWILLTFSITISAQEKLQLQGFTDTLTGTKEVSVTPEKDFDSWWLPELFLGEHWRDLWTTPIMVPVLDMHSFAGGLEIIPDYKPGGMQTKSLEFNGKDGKKYKFRSTLKYIRRAIDPELYGTIAESILQDQISIKHPYAPVIAYSLLNSVGILMPEPVIYVLPSDGRFTDEFKGMLGTIQEIPAGTKNTIKGFNGFDKVIKTESLLKKMDKDPANFVNASEFLKARLMDVLMGDWDRHHKQWKWGKSTTENKGWLPVSMDRDEAFCRYDGILPWLYAKAIPRFEGISENYPLVDFITWEGRYLDRKFLTSLTKPQWDSVTAIISTNITDKIIHNAVSLMPLPWYMLKGKMLERILRARRDKIKEISEDYYNLISQEPNVWGSDKNDNAEIEILNNEKIKIKLSDQNGSTFFEKIFDSEHTSEVRIYLQDGDDKAVVKGNNSSDITIRVIGGNGKDLLIDSSTPGNGSTDIRFYDSDHGTVFKEGDNTHVDDSYYPMPKNVISKINPVPQDFSNLWNLTPILNFNTDEGFIFGAVPIYYKYGFRFNPYKYRLSLAGSYSVKSVGYFVKFTADLYSIIKNVKTSFSSEYSKSMFARFYGFGNESILNKDLDNNGYYKVEQNAGRINTFVTISLLKNLFWKMGGYYTNIITQTEPNTIVTNTQSHDAARFNFLGLYTGLIYDNRNSTLLPSKGTFVQAAVSHSPDLFKNGFKFTKMHFDLSQVFFENFIKKSFFKAGVYAEKITGTYPFYEAPALGGNSLRGYVKNRFTGDAAVSGSLDLSIFLGTISAILPADLGVLFISDAGKVFYKGENSNKIHYSYGGGFTLSYMKRMVNFQAYAANSNEGTKFYFTSIFGF